jgi:AcrR family transcriptional regulator
MMSYATSVAGSERGDATRPAKASVGRRGGDSGTREAILAAARELFASKGFDGASLRMIASAASVDTGLIRHFYGSKDELFAATLHIPEEIIQRVLGALAGDRRLLGRRMTDAYLTLWEDPATAEPIRAIARSAIASDKAGDRLRAILSTRLVQQALPHLAADQQETRATLAGAHLLGIALARYVVRVEPLASLDRETLVAMCGPAIQRYLTQKLP